MNGIAARLAALGLGLTAASTTAVAAAMVLPSTPLGAWLHYAQERVFPSAETRLLEEGPKRRAEVLAEIARLSGPSWVGVYRTKGAWPDGLAIAPAAGFVLHEGSWCGTCARDSAIGRVVADEGTRLKLALDLVERQDPPRENQGLDEVLYFVRWGELTFAVPKKQMESFCAEVADGSTFPMALFRATNATAAFDPEKPTRPAGTPELPAEFAKLIPTRPLSCIVGANVAWERRPEFDGKDNRAWDATFALDAGANAGLVAGMRLFVEGGSRYAEFRGRVERVEPSTAQLRLLVFDESRAWAEGLPGTRATTLVPAMPIR